MLSRCADIEQRQERCGLSAGRAYSTDASFEGGKLLLIVCDGGIRYMRLHMTVGGKIKQLADIVGGVIGICR